MFKKNVLFPSAWRRQHKCFVSNKKNGGVNSSLSSEDRLFVTPWRSLSAVNAAVIATFRKLKSPIKQQYLLKFSTKGQSRRRCWEVVRVRKVCTRHLSDSRFISFHLARGWQDENVLHQPVRRYIVVVNITMNDFWFVISSCEVLGLFCSNLLMYFRWF